MGAPKDREQVEPANPSAALARRVEDYIRRRQETEPAYSGRQLARDGGFSSDAQVSATLARLRRGAGISNRVLDKLALAMGTTSGELLGAPPSPDVPPRLGDLPAWDAAAAAASRRYMMRPEGLAAIAAWRPDVPPKSISDRFVVSLYRAWEDLRACEIATPSTPTP